MLYHSVSDEPWQYAVSPVEFERQMKYIAERYDVIPLEQVLKHMGGAPLTRSAVSVTFDDGYRDFLTNALPVLKKFSIPATVFVSLEETARRELGTERELLRRDDAIALQHSLVTLGSHALTHRKLRRLSVDEVREEAIRSRELLCERFGALPSFFAYPKGSHSPAVAQAVKEAGYDAAFTTEPRAVQVGEEPYMVPRIQIDATISFAEFKARLTRAADWYYAMRRYL